MPVVEMVRVRTSEWLHTPRGVGKAVIHIGISHVSAVVVALVRIGSTMHPQSTRKIPA